MLFPAADDADDLIGELLPSAPLMRACQMSPDGKGGVKQQHALLGPSGQVTRHRDVGSHVVFDFLIYIDQRRRNLHAVRHRERQSLRLPRLMIRVLPENDHFELVERAEVESPEDVAPLWIDGGLCIFRSHEIRQLAEIVLFKLALEPALP